MYLKISKSKSKELKELTCLYIGLLICIKAESTNYFINCSAQPSTTDKYISCDGNRKSDCYYKVLNTTPSEWQLDGWIECTNCLTNYSLILQTNHFLNINFTLNPGDEDESWQGILINITFPNSKEIKSIRRWFLLNKTFANFKSFNYNCINAFDNPHDYKVDFIKIYNQDKRYSIWNSEWFSILTPKNIHNDIQVCFNTPPRIYNFSGFVIFLSYSKEISKEKKINNTGKFESEICVLFEGMPTNNYSAKLVVTNVYCDCNPTNGLPNGNIELDLCSCPLSLSNQFFHEFDPSYTAMQTTNLATLSNSITIETIMNLSTISNINNSITISKNAIIAMVISSIVIICILLVIIYILVQRLWCREQIVYNIFHFGNTLINKQFAENIRNMHKQRINDDKKMRFKCDVALLIHDECDFNARQSSSPSIEHRCSCFKYLDDELMGIRGRHKLRRAIRFTKKRPQDSTYVFPDQALEICRLFCRRESEATEAIKELSASVDNFIKNRGSLTILKGASRDSGYSSNPNSLRKNLENVGEDVHKIPDIDYHDCGEKTEETGIGNDESDNKSLDDYISQLNGVNFIFDLTTRKILISTVVF